MPEPSLNPLASTLKTLRRQHNLSLNQLAQLTGISRRTLARIEAGYYSRRARGQGGSPTLSPRIAFRLARFLLPPDRLTEALARSTRLPDPYHLLPDFYPAFLFHQAPEEYARTWRNEFAPDYRNAFLRLIVAPGTARNLAQRLRAFRLQHNLTLQETAHLLDLSTSQLHRLERAQRQPSPKTRFKILRLLTLPLPAGQGSSPAEPTGHPHTGERPARSSRRERLGQKETPAFRQQFLSSLKDLLSLRPPRPLEFDDDPDCLHRLRYLWLSGRLSTRELADFLAIGQPHLIRLLRGDRKPSSGLRTRIRLLTRSL